MNQPIGVSFLPSEDNQQQGLQRGAMEGDLGQALKILSLQLPTVRGARPITPWSNLGNQGAAGLQSPTTGFNPGSAIMEAVFKALAGLPSSQQPGAGGALPAPNIIPGINSGNFGPLADSGDAVDLGIPRPAGGYQGYDPSAGYAPNKPPASHDMGTVGAPALTHAQRVRRAAGY